MHKVAGVAGDEKLADPVAAEDEFRRDAAIGAGDHCRPWRLMPRDRGALRSHVDRAEFRMTDIARVAFLERGERLVRRERRRRSIGRPRGIRRADKRRPGKSRSCKLKEIPSDHEFAVARFAHPIAPHSSQAGMAS